MTWRELKKRIITEYDSRNLKSKVRYNAIERVENFIEQYHTQAIEEVKELIALDKQCLKTQYAEQKGRNISGAENSVINEIYNQLSNL
jgi:hypothetical protein